MLAIKEISRVPAVERKWLETWKRTEDGGGPFPPVAQHIVNAESALAFGKRIHWRGVPTVKIEIASLGIGRLTAPRVCPRAFIGGAIGGPPAPPPFVGPLPLPPPVPACLSLAYRHR